jgi:hypothetical protein
MRLLMLHRRRARNTGYRIERAVGRTKSGWPSTRIRNSSTGDCAWPMMLNTNRSRYLPTVTCRFGAIWTSRSTSRSCNDDHYFFPRAPLLGDPFEGSSTKPMVAARRYIMENRASDPALAGFKNLPDSFFSTWGDAFKRMVQKNYLVSCWHMNEHESAAMWSLYLRSNEGVCIQSTYRRLRSGLPKCVFIGEVNYIDYQTRDSLPTMALTSSCTNASRSSTRGSFVQCFGRSTAHRTRNRTRRKSNRRVCGLK